ncbi:putative ABC transporter ATP-binding protein [Methanosarcinaceae archaeon Ag5]|uniref:ABC transporter ATP-binding protein n=1 Tax=Methanolapillus africanus TaxID=3028297 RepID=A0AAE4SDW6_9EURY|nr:putative ABC transporter ATP-binding protein [Methanosarcinaceae archaeon Ag5]
MSADQMSSSSQAPGGSSGGRGDKGGGFYKGGRGALNIPAEKPKNFKKTFGRLMQYLKPYRLSIIVVILATILSTVFTVLAPLLIGDAVNVLYDGVAASSAGTGGIDDNALLRIIWWLLALYVASALFGYVQQYLMAVVSQKTVSDLRNDIGDKLSRLPLKYYDTHTHGETMSRIINDVDTISNTLQQSLIQMITSAVTILGIFFIMLYISPLLTLVCLITIPASAYLTKVIASKSQIYFRKQQEQTARMNGHIEEMYTGHKIIKAFGREKESAGMFDKINDELTVVSQKSQFISGIVMPVLYFVQNVGYVVICIFGCIFVLGGTMSIGSVQSFMLYSKQFTQPIIQLSAVVNSIQSTVAAAEHIFRLLDEEEEIPDPAPANAVLLQNPDGNVSFEHVNFGYDKNIQVISDLSLSAKSGDMIAIVGPTGAGKTTLLNLLMRFYEIEDGQILIDGVDISKMRRSDLRSLFGMVLQNAWLFNGTIRDNIAYGRDNATEDEIIRAAQMAHADGFIRLLPDGYNTIINEEASNISEGQKQLLTIARAFLSDPEILLLDEATSNVDTRTESLIREAMETLMKGRTSFVIAHRLSTIKNADLILVMNKGKIIEKGTHKELMDAKGFYAELYNSQFSNTNLDETFAEVERKFSSNVVTAV